LGHFLKGKICLILALIVTCLLLLACGDEQTPTPSFPTSQNTISKTITANPTTGQSVVSAAILTPTLSQPSTPIPQNDALTQAKSALIKLRVYNSYRYKVQQKATLSSGSASSVITAEGEGLINFPNLSQKLTLTVSGQAQQLDSFILNGIGWQKLSSLAVWRKTELNPRWEVQLSEQLLDKASAVQGSSADKLIKVTVSLPVALFFNEPGSFGPDWLGILSATGLKNGLAGANATGMTQLTFWIDNSSGQLAQRQTLVQYGSPDNRLVFEANYQYQDFNASNLQFSVPTDIPRQP